MPTWLEISLAILWIAYSRFEWWLPRTSSVRARSFWELIGNIITPLVSEIPWMHNAVQKMATPELMTEVIPHVAVSTKEVSPDDVITNPQIHVNVNHPLGVPSEGTTYQEKKENDPKT